MKGQLNIYGTMSTGVMAHHNGAAYLFPLPHPPKKDPTFFTVLLLPTYETSINNEHTDQHHTRTTIHAPPYTQQLTTAAFLFISTYASSAICLAFWATALTVSDVQFATCAVVLVSWFKGAFTSCASVRIPCERSTARKSGKGLA